MGRTKTCSAFWSVEVKDRKSGSREMTVTGPEPQHIMGSE